MSYEIRISSRSVPPGALCRELRSQLGPESQDISLDVVTPTGAHRTGIEAVVLVAVISSSSGLVQAVINGVFSLLASRRQRPSGQVVIRGKDGATVEFPPDLEPEQIPRLVELTRALDAPTIELP
jgi:hypothetical protein